MQPSRWESSFPTIPLNSAVSAAFTASSLPLQPNTPGAAGWSAHPALSKFLNQHRLGKIVALRHFTADRPQELHVLPGRAGPKPSAANRRTPFQDVPQKAGHTEKAFAGIIHLHPVRSGQNVPAQPASALLFLCPEARLQTPLLRGMLSSVTRAPMIFRPSSLYQ